MKDKRLEVKLSVRGDGSLTRNGVRSSTRSNRSNASNSSGLPQSEIFATDRYSSPYHRSFDILDKYRRQPNQYGYPAQSLQALNQYDQRPRTIAHRNNPYIDYNEQARPPSRRDLRDIDYHERPYYAQARFARLEPRGYLPVYEDPSGRPYGTLPRASHHDYRSDPRASNHYTLPAQSGPRRVRIRESPIIHGYGT